MAKTTPPVRRTALIASAVAVMVRLISAGVAENSCASIGSRDCGA